MSVTCINPPTIDDVNRQVSRLTPEIAASGLPWSISRSIAGALVGNIAGKQIGEEDDNYGALGTLLGVFAGSPTAIKQTSKALKWGKTQAKSHLPDELQPWIKLEEDFRALETPNALGFKVDPRDGKAVRETLEATQGIKLSLLRGRNAVEDFLGSGWVQSQWSTLRKFGKAIPVVNKLQEVLTDIPNKIKQMKGSLDSTYNGQGRNHTYQQFLDELGPQKIAQAFEQMAKNVDTITGSDVAQSFRNAAQDRKTLQKEFNDSVWRYLHTGKGATEQQRRNVEAYYLSNPFAKSLDDILSQDQQFTDFVAHNRAWYKQIEDQARLTFSDQMARDLAEIETIASASSDPIKQLQYKNTVLPMLKEFIESKQSLAQFKAVIEESGDDVERGRLTALLNAVKEPFDRADVLAKRIIETNTRLNQFDRFSGAYIPQIESETKKRALKARLLQDPNSGVTDDATFEKYIDRMYYDVNYKDDRKLYYDDHILDTYDVRQYGSRKAALDDVKKKVLANTTFSQQERLWAEGNIDQFIKEGTVTKAGKTKKFWFIESPNNAPVNYFSDHNRAINQEFMQRYRNTNQYRTKQSSRIDKVRKAEMPVELAQTDIRYLANTYANDVAPRLHAIQNRMFDETDLRENYFAPIMRATSPDMQGTVSDVTDRIANIYNTSFRINNFTSPTEFELFEKNARWANRFRNIMAGAYQYGIGYYNIFEHAVVSPLLTSWGSYGKTMKLFAFNKDSANAISDLIQDFHVIDRQLKSQSGNLDYDNAIAGDNWVDRMLEKGANISGEFSVTDILLHKKALGKFIRKDDLGLSRVMFGSFVDSNIMSTGINAMASLYEVRKLSQIYKQLLQVPENAPKVTTFQGRQYTMGEVTRGLEQMGIGSSRIDSFLSADVQNALEMVTRTVESGGRLSQQQLKDNYKAMEHVQTVLNYATESYHATNPMFRPENAMTPIGRMLFQYSNYPFNMVFQNYQRRIAFPIQDWTQQFGVKGSWNIANVHYNFMKGNFDELRKMGLSNQAIENYPADAMTHIVKYLGIAMGLSTLGNMSIDVFRDVIAYPFKEEEKDQWARVKRKTTLNPFAPKADQQTLGDLFDDPQIGDLWNLGKYMATLAFDNGLAGRYDIFYNQYGQPSLTDITPVSRFVDGVLKDVHTITSGDNVVSNFGENVTKVATRNVFSYMPVFGSSVFSESRKTLQKRLTSDPKRPITPGANPLIDFNLINTEPIKFSN
jgi:hypothetical protein